jgi:PH domain
MRFGATAAAASISRSSSRNGYRGGLPPAFHMPSTAMSPIARSHSVNHSRRIPSLTTAPPPLREETAAEAAIEEPVSPTEIDADGDVTPTATQPGCRRDKAGDAHHDGWMKKRRTRMLRHEWQDAHFRLRGTQLAMHEDERAAAALEFIDVDDYAVAVSGAPGDSKLNAAMRRLHLNNKRAQLDSHAFAFQLTPAAERKGIRYAATGKTHHFAVRTATERIDWMRELMLARARREKGVDIASFD